MGIFVLVNYDNKHTYFCSENEKMKIDTISITTLQNTLFPKLFSVETSDIPISIR